MPSSSGVSSSGSLHLSPESEIYEEEYEDDDDGLPECALLNNTRGTSPHVHFIDQQSDGSSTNESSVTITDNHVDQLDSDTDNQFKMTSSAKHHSATTYNNNKSLPTISSMNSKALPDGGGSPAAEVMRLDNSSKKKMSHGDLLRMKKQLLLNSTLEASEV